MKASNKNRRSERIPARHNLMLVVEDHTGGTAAKEIVSTVHISRHGAHLRSRRPLDGSSKGNVMNLSSCRQTPFRIAWHLPSDSHPGYHESGIEFVESIDFWGRDFSGHRQGAASAEDVMGTRTGGLENSSAANPRELLDQLLQAGDTPKGHELTAALWCGLIKQLEERRVFTRTDLISALKKLSRPS